MLWLRYSRGSSRAFTVVGRATLSARHGTWHFNSMHIHIYRNNRDVLDLRELLAVRFTVDLFIGNVRVRLRIILVRASAPLLRSTGRHVTIKTTGAMREFTPPGGDIDPCRASGNQDFTCELYFDGEGS